ncbi:MAG: undecaprenyl-phosphate glucose phosphotransferase [Rhizobiales bacterium]|nr:undecaprenyl-phosphate glucose phosphotransferase [Hyphomicrobiales bacterium]
MRVVEAVLLLVMSVVVYAIYLGTYTTDMLMVYTPLVIAASGLFSVFLHAAKLYSVPALLQPVKAVPKLTAALVAVFAAMVAFVFFSKIGENYSRVWLGSWMLSSLGAATILRFAVARAVQRWTLAGRLNRRALIVGGGETAARLIKALESSKNSDVSIVGIFDDRDDERSPGMVAGYPKLGTIDQLEQFARSMRIDLLLITLPVQAESRLIELARKLWILPVDIRLSANSQILRYSPRAYSYIGDVAFLDIFDRPLGDGQSMIKTLTDKVLASIALVLVSPVMLLIAIAIKLESSGAVLFKQKRYGFNNELVEVYKFRSMYTDRCDEDAAQLVTRDDSRVTRIGRFIRATSLDELPQLFNVLQGNLSLVGPRPHATQAKADNALYQEAVESYYARHRVKPGITGWAQINGWRGETDTVEKIQQRVEHDLYYIENWSLMLDLYILMRTPFALLNTDQAY